MYAIVDIETTGGYASANGITEIAIVLHDGKEIVHRFQTLINPGMPIPVYISALTGIDDTMVADAPSFEDVAGEVYNLLKDRIFVAHNVNFDFSFVRHQLQRAGYDLRCNKLCTVRLGRKILPGFPSYSLGRLCKQLNITIEDRHRAGGDAQATALLFSMLLEKDVYGHISQALKHHSKDRQIPPYLEQADIDRLPSSPGVYYFKDQKGRAIYVGKAKNLKKRVLSHFSGNNSSRQRQEFMKSIRSVSFEECGTELMAFILEAVEIKRLWPANNRALKRFDMGYGLYLYEDQRGYMRLAIDKKRKHASPVYTFNLFSDGHNKLQSLMIEFKLCPKLCFIQKNTDPCTGMLNQHCYGACRAEESHTEYNARVKLAIEKLRTELPSFALLDEGRSSSEKSVILVEEGRLKAMGYIDPATAAYNRETFQSVLTPYSGDDYVRNLIQNYALRFPEKVLPIN